MFVLNPSKSGKRSPSEQRATTSLLLSVASLLPGPEMALSTATAVVSLSLSVCLSPFVLLPLSRQGNRRVWNIKKFLSSPTQFCWDDSAERNVPTPFIMTILFSEIKNCRYWNVIWFFDIKILDIGRDIVSIEWCSLTWAQTPPSPSHPPRVRQQKKLKIDRF